MTYGDQDGLAPGAVGDTVTLEAHPERCLLCPGGDSRHVDLRLRVAGRAPGASGAGGDREALRLALVLDRSGSMAGWKLETAKRAALAALDRLDGRDRVAVVVFDDRIDVLQPAATVTSELKARLHAALTGVDARGTTALHQGWLAGCRAVAVAAGAPGGDDLRAAAPRDAALARSFLLTDGLANVGLTDPEQIATEAASVRERAGVGTSTFGIGEDYDEALLGPMAVAGGGQFHHLRTAEDLARTFAGELGELFAAAAPGARLELEAGPGVTADVVSAYWARPAGGPGRDGGLARWTVALGDLLAGEERHVVVRFGFPPASLAGGGGRREQARQVVRARATWTAGGQAHATPWLELGFAYAPPAACDAEAPDRDVLRRVGLHHADRARLEATRLSRSGDPFGAQRVLRHVIRHLEAYAPGDPELQAALDALRAYELEVAYGAVDSAVAKETVFDAQRRSRGKFDYRNDRD